MNKQLNDSYSNLVYFLANNYKLPYYKKVVSALNKMITINYGTLEDAIKVSQVALNWVHASYDSQALWYDFCEQWERCNDLYSIMEEDRIYNAYFNNLGDE